jgi:hypothetical protein
MARGHSSARPSVARREDGFRDAGRRKNCSSLNDQCLAEKAIRAERVVDQISANECSTVQPIARTVARDAPMTNPNNSPKRGKVFEEDEVVRLLSAAIERDGGQTAFAKRHGLDRSGVNMILHGKKRVNDTVAAALGLRRVYVSK